MTLKEWLDTPCKEDEVACLDAEKTIEYIPIGIVEKILDEAGYWGTSDFKFSTYKSVNTTFASGSIVLTIGWYNPNGDLLEWKRVGAATIPIFTTDENKDYEGTVLSLALSNAAKKFGRRLGRHLNGRMEVGETAIQIKREPEEESNRSDDRWVKMLQDCKTLEELAGYKDQLPSKLMPEYMKQVRKLT